MRDYELPESTARRLIGREPDQNLSEELRFHLEMEAAKLERGGLSPRAARREARKKFGGVDRYTEELRDERRGNRGSTDRAGCAVRAARSSRRFPVFTAIVVLTLGIAIGANTAIFSVVERGAPAAVAISQRRSARLCSTRRIRTGRCRASASRTPTISIGERTPAASPACRRTPARRSRC